MLSRPSLLALLAYAAPLASLFTPLYDFAPAGRDQSWALIVLLVATHVGLGLSVRGGWVLAVPVLPCLGWVVYVGASVFLFAGIGFLVLLALTAVGQAAGRALRSRGSLSAAAFALASLPLVWGVVETLERSRAPHVTRSLQGELPIGSSLGNLCGRPDKPTELQRRTERSAEVLVRELDREPRALVTYMYTYADSSDTDRREITVRELAEEQLDDLGPSCAPRLRRRIEVALG